VRSCSRRITKPVLDPAAGYDDEIVSTEDGWQIANRTFTMVHVTADIGARLVTTWASDL
jgi:hypothetical protein